MSTGRKFAIVAAVFLALGAAVAAPAGLLGERGHDPSVASIEGDREYQDPSLLAAAFEQPVASAYQRGGLDQQRNPSFCGPTTAVDVLRSLGNRADQDTILDGTGIRTWFGLVWGGLTLDDEAELIRGKTGRKVTVLRDLDLQAFREELRHVNDPGLRYVVNFSRQPLFGRGGGHHSPIGAYLPDRDLVLVLDVNGRYRPWLVNAERLFQAQDTVDGTSGRKRGLLRIE